MTYAQTLRGHSWKRFHTLGGWLAGRARGLLDRVRPGLERDGFSYMLALRRLPVVPFWLVNLALALVGMRLGSFA